MTNITRITSELRADLVAYLDGELDDASTDRVEQALASNPVVRREVEMLTRTWEMLETIPREKASEEFTAKTLETIVLAEQETSITDSAWYQTLKQVAIYTGYFAGLATIGVVCFLLTYSWIPIQSDPLVEDLPVIRDLDRFSALHSKSYLERLKNRGDFYDDLTAPTGEGDEPEE